VGFVVPGRYVGTVDARPQLGRKGEQLAADHYRALGFRVIDRNYRCREGELDLVLGRPGIVVFCEVKTRRSTRFGEPSEAVGFVKQRRLRRLAAHWLRERRPGSVQVRFDVVSVIVRGDRSELTHVPDAF
jgi:putative endonuclease